MREALISLRKEDDEAQQILIASVEVGILTRHGETYLPSLRTVLQFPKCPKEVRGWYALYLFFVLEDAVEFYSFTVDHHVDSYYLDIARASINGNYIAYTALVRKGTRFDKALIQQSPADIRMKKRIIDIVGKCYYRVEIAWFNKLSKTDRWEQDGNMYIVKRQPQRAS